MKLVFLIIPILFAGISQPSAQENIVRGWTELVTKDSLNIEFLFYSEADNYNNGIVVKLANLNEHQINYKFDLIFRSEEADTVINVLGSLFKSEVKTGSNDSLFWIPFKDKRRIGEVGITNIRVWKSKEEDNLPR